MGLEKLKTEQVADIIKDRIDDLRVLKGLPEPALKRMTSFKKLLREINETDIDLCGYLDQEAQIIIFLPEGYSEIYLRNSELQSGEYFDEVDSIGLPDGQEVALFNYDFWTAVRGVKSTYIESTDEFPLGDRKSSKRYKLVPYDEFTDVTEQFKDQVYEDVSPAFYDSKRSRIILDSPVSSNTFIHFVGKVIPEKIDFTQVTEGEWSEYTITAPEVAEEAIVLGVLKRLMPMGSEIRNLYAAEYEREKQMAAGRMPIDTSSFTLDSNVGP